MGCDIDRLKIAQKGPICPLCWMRLDVDPRFRLILIFKRHSSGLQSTLRRANKIQNLMGSWVNAGVDSGAGGYCVRDLADRLETSVEREALTSEGRSVELFSGGAYEDFHL